MNATGTPGNDSSLLSTTYVRMYVNGRLISGEGGEGGSSGCITFRVHCVDGRSETQQSIPPRQTRLEKGGTGREAAYGDGRANN